MPPDELMPLDQRTGSEGSGWAQVHVRFTHWHRAEHTAALQLRPLLDTEVGGGGWWFVRKHPCWRLRYRPTDDDAPHRLATALDDLVGTSAIRSWTRTSYEPETHAFGGPAAMEVAHELFHHDCRGVLDLLHRDNPAGGTVSSLAPLPRRRELTVIAISLLLRAAGQDWFEQGDVWAKVADLRRAEHAPLRVAGDAPTSLRRLMTIDTGPSSSLAADGPLTPLAEWLAAFEHAGHRLAELSRRGSLQRGLRAVLAHHVIFHWNRIGLAHTRHRLMTDTAPVANTATDTEVIARRFPLVPRPHPPCPPIDVRIAEVITLVRAAGRGDNEALGRTAAAHNNAALIASDCGLPDLARTLCWQHHDRYPRTGSWSAQEARYALEPLVNLARLHIRAGNTDAGLHLLNSLYDAVRLGVETEIDGRPLDFHNLTTSSGDHHTLCRWLWTVVLADGLRVLTRAGRWEHALAHAQHHNGIGQRLLDGRQIAVLTSALRGDSASATNLLDESILHESWERAVAACLRVITCRHTSRSLCGVVPDMINRYLALQPSRQRLVFHVRLGLTVIDLAGGISHPDGERAAAHVIHHATNNIDGYTARELLAHEAQEHLPHSDRETLLAARRASVIDRNPNPDLLTTTLLNALQGCEQQPAAVVDRCRI